MGFRREKRRSVRGGSWWSDFSSSVKTGYSNSNTKTGKSVYQKALCEAPFRGARAMSSAYSAVPFSPTLNCGNLTTEQKEIFNNWQSGSPGFCGDQPFMCNTGPMQQQQMRQQSKPNGYFTSSDLGPAQPRQLLGPNTSFDSGARAGRRPNGNWERDLEQGPTLSPPSFDMGASSGKRNNGSLEVDDLLAGSKSRRRRRRSYRKY